MCIRDSDCPRAMGCDFHPFLGIAAAGRRQDTFALYLDHARTAVAVGPETFLVAKARNLEASLIGDLKKGLVAFTDNRLSIEDERQVSHYFTSPEKCLRTDRIGFGAACPRPQIDASIIADESSLSKGSSQCFSPINSRALTVPTLHGVHWPQDSFEKKFRRLRAVSDALS